ncbi:CoA transferase [Achromobacter aegrifaciens]
MTLPFLAGLRVIESSAFIAAPLAGLTLSQFGADVIRVDMIGGGIDYGRLPLAPNGRSLYWTGLNKGKRSVAVDIGRPEGREIVRALTTAPGPGGGMLLTNIATPWLYHESLATLRPDLVSCTIQGDADGSTALDYTVNCATGYPVITGSGSLEAPVNHVLPAWDVACAYQAAFAILAAECRRRVTGEGAELKLALSDVAFTTMSHLGVITEAEMLGQERPSIGNYLYGAFGRDFGTVEGKRVMVAAISISQWTGLVRACGAERAIATLESSLQRDFSREADRYEAREAIAQVFEPWFASRTLGEIESAFKQHRVCWGLYRNVRDLIANDPRVSLTNPVFERMNTQGIGTHLAAGTPVRAMHESRGATVAAPLLGQHTDEVLSEVLGIGASAIGRLHDQNIVAGPERDPTVFIKDRKNGY